jgi:hypothetical protein
LIPFKEQPLELYRRESGYDEGIVSGRGDASGEGHGRPNLDSSLGEGGYTEFRMRSVVGDVGLPEGGWDKNKTEGEESGNSNGGGCLPGNSSYHGDGIFNEAEDGTGISGDALVVYDAWGEDRETKYYYVGGNI